MKIVNGDGRDVTGDVTMGAAYALLVVTLVRVLGRARARARA